MPPRCALTPNNIPVLSGILFSVISYAQNRLKFSGFVGAPEGLCLDEGDGLIDTA